MKKTLLLVTIAITPFLSLKSQVTIGSGKPPESYSTLQLDSANGGLRLNQLSEEQKAALQKLLPASDKDNPAKGLVIYNLESGTIQYWDGKKWIHVVGTESKGEAGQYLHLNGSKQPEWTTLKIPQIKKGDYYLYSSITMRDMTGVDVIYKNEDNDNEAYKENDLINDKWQVIEGLTQTIHIPDIKGTDGKDATRVSIQFQAGGQINTGIKKYYPITSNGYTQFYSPYVPTISFAIGVFVGNETEGYKLKIVRPTRIEANGGGTSFSLYSVMGTVSNLPAGDQTIKIAVRRRASYNMDALEDKEKTFSFGREISGSNNANPFMTQSSLRVDVFALDIDN